MTRPLAIAETVFHANHELVRSGVLSFMPDYRMIPYADGNVPTGLGMWQGDVNGWAQVIRRSWRNIAPERRWLKLECGLRRCCDRKFPLAPGETPPTFHDIITGLINGYFVVSGDIAVLHPLAQRIRDLGTFAGFYIDAEIGPCAEQSPPPRDKPDLDDYSDVMKLWQQMGKSRESMGEATHKAWYESAVMLADVMGWNEIAVVVAECHPPVGGWRGSHWWDSKDVIPSAPGGAKTYCHLDAALPVADFRAQLELAATKNVSAVFVYAEPFRMEPTGPAGVTAEHLSLHEPALREACDVVG